uniref:Uncharacterized protein n=1 Tax=Acrobeloides nanus TaxID=290746 RepID=A0A914BYT3_9BILA
MVCGFALILEEIHLVIGKAMTSKQQVYITRHVRKISAKCSTKDPYELYHVRNGINSPRVDDKGHLVRERPKILMDDLTAGKHFDDR